MKNNIKKILIISTSTFATIGTSAAIGISTIANASGLNINSVNSKAVVNATFDPNKSLVFQGKTYKNIYHAIETYASNAENVIEKTFVGDVMDATSITNKYETVNLSKLREYDLTKISKAYKTLTDSYVSSIDEAKQSYLKEPVIAWTDNSGSIFDSEGEAAESILNNKFTSPVSYYEVKDYANKDSNGNPTIVKINPLNKKDVQALKRIAGENFLIEDSGFTLSRMSSSDAGYVNDDFKGWTNQQINETLNKLTQGVTDLVKKNMWLNTNVVAKPDNNKIQGKLYGSFGSVTLKKFSISYGTFADGGVDNSSIGTTYDTIINDSVYITDKEKFLQKFNMYSDTFSSTDPYRDATIKGGQTIFGGQKYRISLDATQKSAIMSWVMLEGWTGEEVSFLGRGKQSNIWFYVNPNQEKYAELMKNNDFKTKQTENANNVVTQVDNYIKTNFNSFLSDQEITTLIANIKDPIINVLTNKIIEKDQIWINAPKSTGEIKVGLDKLNSIILNKIDQLYKEKTGKTFTDVIREKTIANKQYVENKDTNDIIYTFNYNGVPLFKLEKSLFGSLYADTNEMFRVQPLEEVKKSLKFALTNNFQAAITNIVNGLSNISNSFNKKTSTNNGLVADTVLAKSTIDNYKDSSKKQNNFGFVSKTGEGFTNNFDATYSSKFIDEFQFAKYGLTDQSLIKSLNATKLDDESLLQNQNGIFLAIKNYNNNLQNYLSKASPSDIQKKTLSTNYVSDPNDVIFLFNADKTPLQVKYSEYFDNSYKFNESLSDNSVSLIKSIEEKEESIESNKLNKPTKVVIVKDSSGNIVNFESVNGNTITNDGYATSKEQALENAKNQIDVKESLDYVFYNNDDNSQVLLKNKVTKLNVLSINNNGTKSTYGFLKYQDLYNYLFDYIKLNSEGNGSSLPDSQPPFSAESINTKAIADVLATVHSLDDINKSTLDEKFNQFGSAFGISDLNTWKMYIKNLSFAPKQVNQRAEQQVTMSVQLNEGFKYADGKDTLNLDVSYTPAGDLEPLPGVNGQSTQAKTALIASVTSSLLLILLLEVVLISVILINKRKQENIDEKKLMKLVNKNGSK